MRPWYDPQTLGRLRQVKRIIDRAPHRVLDVDALARVAAMNRTKLRALFKQAFGTTLTSYRKAVLLQQADRALRERGSTVGRIAFRAGYANASSFIVAYKRYYGISPGVAMNAVPFDITPSYAASSRISE
jgi:AraC-like DNA-binding protein